MDDGLESYEKGLGRIFDLVSKDHPNYLDLLLLQSRLIENIKRTRAFGETDARNSTRTEIIDSLNRLLMPTLGKSFNELCGLSESLSVLKPQAEAANEAFSSARTYIVKVQNSLRYTYKLFTNEEDIWPSQCERAVSTLISIGEPVFPQNTSTSPMMIELFRIDDLVTDLVQLIRDYRRLCRKPLSQTRSTREKIDHKLEAIVQSLSEANISLDSSVE